MKQITLCNDWGYIFRRTLWLGPIDHFVKLDKANEMFLTEHMRRIPDIWEDIKLQLADRIDKWGGNIQLSDTIRFRDLWEESGKNWLRVYVVSSKEEDTQHLAQRFNNAFVQMIREDQTEFYENFYDKIKRHAGR